MNQIYNPSDTICAICTPPGQGAIAIIRLSGPEAFSIADSIWKGKRLSEAPSHTVHLGEIADEAGNIIDQALATVFRSPHSYTGDDTVEFSLHGSRWIQRTVIGLLIAAGARQALNGEYTQRAFRSGKLDLAQAEAVADLIASQSRAAQRLAMNQMKGGISGRLAEMRQSLLELATMLELELDFSEEDVEFADRSRLISVATEVRDHLRKLSDSFMAGNAIKEGIPVAIVGAPNAGKSSLLNALLNDDRAIVSEIPGTTRDTIEETLEIGDYLFRFIDTAGIRHTSDKIESIGIERAISAIAKAYITICVTDATALPDPETTQAASKARKLIKVVNKTDLRPSTAIADDEIAISAKTGAGIPRLLHALSQAIEKEDAHQDILVTNQRHATAIADALQAARSTVTALAENLPSDIIAQEVRQTIHHLGTVTGDIPATEILQTIFSTFCIGK